MNVLNNDNAPYNPKKENLSQPEAGMYILNLNYFSSGNILKRIITYLANTNQKKELAVFNEPYNFEIFTN